MKKICSVSGKPFEISEEDLKFYETISPVFAGKKYLIPPPTLCPFERRRRRLAFRNERIFYRRVCDLCGKHVISVYSQDKPFTIYCRDCWWSDQWDALKFGRDFDFSRPFFDQFAELQALVPRLAMINVNDENSEYSNYGYGNKDCYLLSTSDRNEKCYYGAYFWNSFQCFDCLFILESQWCYQCIDGDSLYECQYCQGCISCQNCFGCIESKNLKNCFGCVGFQNKEYCFFNEQLSKEEYEKRVQEELSDIEKAIEKIRDFAKSFPRRATFQINCENCVGDHLKNCKNIFWGFDGYGAEDCKWITNFSGDVHHCYDFDGAGSVEWCAEIVSTGIATNTCFSIDHNWNGASDVYYSSYSSVNSNLFGCIGLRNKKYCILNKQYKKEEYDLLVSRIIEHMKQAHSAGSGQAGEWGEFFPVHISPFAYNETAAQQVFPLTKDEVLKHGWKWKEEEKEDLKVEKIIPGEKLPKDISKIPDDILNWAVECTATKKPFKIITQELEFYRKHQLSVPMLHPEERHRRRMVLRNPQNLWERTCDHCQKVVLTSFSPEKVVKIWCEECYLKKIY